MIDSKESRDIGHPKITLRVTAAEKVTLQEKAKAAGKALQRYILDAIGHPAVTPRSPQADATIIKAKFNMMMQFFQKNKDNFNLSEQDRADLKDVLAWVKQL
jgi:hypothetical protein